MMDDLFRLSISDIIQKGARSWLTMIGIFIGIAAVVSLISIGQGLQESIDEQFEMLGANVMIIMPGAGITGFATGATALTQHEVDVIKKVRGVDLVGGMITKIAKVEFNDEVTYTWVIGLPQDESKKMIENMGSFSIEKGRDLEEKDKYKVIVGYRFTHGDIFEKDVKVRDKILINDQKFEVVGGVNRIGSPEDDRQIYIPLETANDLFEINYEYIMIMAQAKEGFDVSDVAKKVKEELREDRGLDEGEEDFTVQTSEQLKESAGVVLDIVNYVLIGIASISLLVGGVGIMNTMYTSVLEKTREIGIMKAVGATSRDVLSIFLIESGILGLGGGAIGCVLGVVMAKGVEMAAHQSGLTMLNASITPELILGALGFSFVVGCISGVMPARQAARLKVVDALRYE